MRWVRHAYWTSFHFIIVSYIWLDNEVTVQFVLLFFWAITDTQFRYRGWTEHGLREYYSHLSNKTLEFKLLIFQLTRLSFFLPTGVQRHSKEYQKSHVRTNNLVLLGRVINVMDTKLQLRIQTLQPGGLVHQLYLSVLIIYNMYCQKIGLQIVMTDEEKENS